MFETERCSMHAFQKWDSDDVKKLYVNSEVRKFLGGIRKEDSYKAIHDEMLSQSHGSYYWVVREKQTGDFIGVVSLGLHHDGIDQEISYQFLPDWWGKGYAFEVVAEILDFALNKLNLPKVVAETQVANKTSCKLLEKVGMKLETSVFRFGVEQAIYSIESSQFKLMVSRFI